MVKSITSRFMLQVAGKPVEHVEKALVLVLDKIKNSNNWKFVDGEIIDPELDDETTLYSGLIEVTLKFDSVNKLMEFIVDYTPNSVEVEDPETLTFDIASFNGILNDMSSKFLNMSQQLRQANAGLHFLNNKLKDLESKK